MKLLMETIFFSVLILLMLSIPNAFSSTCSTCSSCSAPPAQSNTNPGGGSPDDTFAVDSGFFREGAQPLTSDPSVVTFQNGFAKETTSFIDAFRKAEAKTDAASTALQLINTTPLLLIPSGGLYGYENSAIFKATLNEYVVQGGTLIVLSQKHGYDYASIPTPDGKPITGYGWEEDQNCFADSVAIESWHQMLSGQSRSTPTLNVDGYFTGYPANATVLLRRTANGQPAMLMYEHGLGRVIVTSMYSDWAYGHGQASQEEIALIRDMLSWAKKPAVLPEVRPGETVSLPVTLANSTATDAATIKLQIWNPDRSTLLSEQTITLAIPAGQSAVNNVAWQAAANAALGIYHVDYILLDAAGNIIQPQAETDSGRFVVSSPPQTGTVKKEIWLSITSPNQEVFFGEPFLYTFHIFNNSATTRNLTLKTLLPHTGRTHEYQVTATANGETVISGSDLFIDSGWMFETLRAYLYDENGVQIASYMLSFKGIYPSVDVTTTPGKSSYAKGETVAIAVNLKNGRNMATAAKLGVMVTDPSNSAIFTTTQDLTLDAGGTATVPLTFSLPATAQGGVYAVATEVMEASGKKIGGDAASFELPLSHVAVVPATPAQLSAGTNSITFNLTNNGKTTVNSGSLDVALKDPDGAVVASVSQPFSLATAQSSTLNIPITIPALKFGTYMLVYSQSDETKSGRPAAIPLASSLIMEPVFDKTSYRIRESVQLSLGASNTGKFSTGSMSLTVSLPDVGYAETKSIDLPPGNSGQLAFTIPLPATMTTGRHSLVATAVLPSGSSVTQEVFVTIPAASLAFVDPAPSYQAGEAANISLRNSGGVDASVESSISLYDSGDLLIATKTDSGAITSGGERIIALPIPAQAVGGDYRLLLTYTGPDGRTVESLKSVRIIGVDATLSAATNKELFLATESISALAVITSQGSALADATLDLKIMPTVKTTYVVGWGQDNPWKGTKQLIDSDSLPKVLRLEHYIKNGDFEYGTIDGWTLSYIYNGLGAVIKEGSRFSGLPTDDVVMNGDYSVNIRSNGAGSTTSSGLLISDPFIPLESSLNWVQRSESPNVYFEARILDINGNLLSSTSLPAITGVFGAQQLDVSAYKGQTIRVAFLQHTTQWGLGWYTLVDDVRNGNAIYHPAGTFESETNDFGAQVQVTNINWVAVTPSGTGVKFQVAANDDNATWNYVGPDGTSGSYYTTAGAVPAMLHSGRYLRWKGYLETADRSVTPILHSMTIQTEETDGRVLWQQTRPVDVATPGTVNVSSSAGVLNTTGKMVLQATLKNGLGQTIGSSTYPFYVTNGTLALTFNSDKPLYRPGETVTISGEVKNLSTVTASGLSFVFKGKVSGTEQTYSSEILTIPAGGIQPFSVTTVAGAEGSVALTGTVTQSGTLLTEITDRFEVAVPRITAALTAPDTVGNDPFTLTLALTNSGKTDASVTTVSSITALPEAVTIPAGQTRLLQYNRQIAADTTDTFTLSGDLTQVITKTIKYGPAVTLAAAPQALYPEGKVSLPVTITNSGLLDSQFTIDYLLTQGATTISQQTKSYFLAKGSSSADTLTFDLGEGSYQLAATGQKPAAAATAAFQVRKETKADLTLAVGAQSGNLLPATVTVANLGYNPIEGSVRVSLVDAGSATAWTATQEVSLPQALSPDPRTLSFSVNLSPLKPGSYTVKAELLDAGNRQLAAQAAPFTLLGPTIAITQLPQYRTIPAGGSSDFTFKVKNSGNQEGAFDLAFRADDLVNVTRSEWLKAGEEKVLTFALQTADDLDEKDYFATYSLKLQGSGSEERGTVKYQLAGIKLAVTAALDRQAYSPGDTATLALTVTQQDAGAAPNLFARVNYGGYNEKQSFTLTGSQTLTFTVPLSQISGEKLFYGIYAESGRSIHLNTIYVYKADGALAISTDKQVFNPGETVNVSVTGTATGELTLTGPGEFSNTFAFSGSDTRSFVLPATMTAGTYTLNAQLKTQDSKLITASHPFDVAGIQVKVKEALLDKTKYAATDTMQLTLTIESNRDIPATVKTWVVDPAGTYTEAGSSEVTLTASAPLLATLNSQLATASLGIHKLVYGIYQGDLLLASGAKAFDIGEAVLLGLATDRTDYPETSVPVIVKADLYGTTAAAIELFLDGVSIGTDNVTLSGTGDYTFAIPPESVTPGLRVLKAVLSAGGLTSSKETRFTFGSRLPDLTGRITAQPPLGGSMNLSLTVANQGKTAAGASRAALYDGDPANGGLLLATLNVPAIDAGSSVTLSHTWNVLGRSGEHLLYARIDSDNSVAEFIEGNNTVLTAVSLPSLSLAVATGKSAYGANEAAAITIDLANLTADLPIENSSLKLRLASASGTTIDLPDRSVGSVAPAAVTTLAEIWNTGTNLPDSYTLTARLVAGTTELASATGSFIIVPTTSLSGNIVPAVAEVPQDGTLEALFTVSNNGNIPLDGLLQVSIRDPQSGFFRGVQEIALQLPVGGTKAGSFSFPLAGFEIKGYELLLGFVSGSAENIIAQSQFSIIDTIPPALTVSALSDGSYTNSETMNVAGTVSDNSGVAKVEVNGATVPVAADGTFSQAVLLQSGANTITTVAADGAGNKTTDSRTIILDKAAPALTITSPADNSKTAVSPIEVTGNVDETSTVTVKLKDNVQTAAMNGAAFTATILPEPGWNTIEITATDLAGNPSSQKRSVLFDDQVPSLAITEPAQDIRTNKSSVTISGTASDPYTAVGVTVALDGTIMTPPVVNNIFSQIVTFTDEKLYPLTVTATNEVGTQVSAQRNVIYDRTPPNLTIDPVVTPTNAPSQTVTGTREEGADVAVSCATATVGELEYPTTTTWRAALAGLAQGENRLQAEVTDLAGNRSAASTTILYVPRAPDVTIGASTQILWPPNRQLVPVGIAGNVVTYGSEIREITISVADEYGKYNRQGVKFGDTLLLEAWREGNDKDGRVYTITAVVTDQAGNVTTRSATVVVPHDLGK